MGLRALDFGRRGVPVVLQSEAAECGLACLAMIAGSHGYETDLASLRQRFSISLKGARLADLIHIAASLRLSSRPLKLDLAQLSQLTLPAILHWDFNHFVVLAKIRGEQVVIHDPRQGVRKLPLEQVSRHFTGIALELAPTHDFVSRTERRNVSFRQLLGRMPGLTGTVAQILALAVALEILGILSPLFMQIVVDSAIVSEDRDLITVLAVGFVLLALIQVGITALRAWMLTFLGTHVNLRLISNLFRHLLRLPVSFFEKRHIGDVVSRFESISTIQRTLTNSFLAAILDGVVAIATLSMMFLYSAKLTGVVLLASVLYATLRFTLLKPYRAVTEEQIVRAARQQSHFLETIRGIQSVKLFNRQNLRFTAWQNLAVDTFNSAVHAQRFVILYQALNGLLFGIENVVVIWLGAHATLDGAFSVGMLFAYVSYKLQFVTRVGALIDKSIEYRMLALHRDRVSDIALAPAETPAVIPQPVSRSLCPSIEVDNVTFRYSDGEPPVLRHLSFSIGADECVAIVGPSGCGKTTLLKIMLGLLTPTEGEVRIGGCRLAQLGVEGFRSLVGVVMQDDQLFSGSIADNISFFDPQIDMQRVVACAETAAIHGELAAMPMGYQTLVGDMGTTLSGGQKQRVLLARALYRQPKILFLDEATSHLDVDGERAVNEAIARIPMTRVLIAHRPETIRMAQRVIQLKSPASASSGARHVREVGS